MDRSKPIIPAEFVTIDPNYSPEGLIIPGEIVCNKKTPEEKKYLIYYVAYDDDGDTYKSFELLEGRTLAYEFIKDMAPCLNVHESMVLVEGVPLEESVTVYDFMKYAKMFFQEDSFDIDDYATGDYTYEDQQEDKHPEISVPNQEAIGIYNKVFKDLLDGNVDEDTDRDDEKYNV